MGSVFKQGVGRALLHDATLVNDRHFIAHMVHHGQVMADEQVGQAELLRQVLHQVEYLRLHRDIERADRFVGHHQAGAGDEGAGHGNPLALAAGELMGKLVEVAGAQAHRLQHVGGLCALLGGAAGGQHAQGLGHDLQHSLARVQRAIRVLKHHLKIAPGAAQGGGRELVEVLPHELDAACTGGFQRHHQPRQGGLARARLAHHTQVPACRHAQIHALQSVHHGRGGPQVLARQHVTAGKLVQVQQVGLGRHGWGGNWSCRRQLAWCSAWCPAWAEPHPRKLGRVWVQAGSAQAQRS